MMATKTLNVAELADRFGVERMTVYRWHKAGDLPRPVIGPGTTLRWHLTAIDQFDQDVEMVETWASRFRAMEVETELSSAPRAFGRVAAQFLEDSRVPVGARIELAKKFKTFPWKKWGVEITPKGRREIQKAAAGITQLHKELAR